MTTSDFATRDEEQKASLKRELDRQLYLAAELVKRSRTSETVRKVVGDAVVGSRNGYSKTRAIKQAVTTYNLSDTQEIKLRSLLEEDDLVME